MSLAQFTRKWTSVDYPPDPVSEADLCEVEQRFAFRLPEDYRLAVLRVGLPRLTIALLDAIVERELDLHSIGDFFCPAEIIEETLNWRGNGMPEHLIAFASDVSGNKFCFDENRLRTGTPEKAAIWFFDHDFGTVEQVATSFEAWVNAYCEVEPCPDAELGQ